MKVLVFCLIYFLISWFEFSLETQPAAQQSSAPQKSSSGAGYSLPAHFGQRRIGAPHLVLRHDQSAGFGRAVFGDLAGTLSSGGETEAPCRVNELGHVSCGVGVEELASRRAGEVPSGTAHCTVCETGVSSLQCQQRCTMRDCNFHGRCDRKSEAGICKCFPGWTGARCDTQVSTSTPGLEQSPTPSHSTTVLSTPDGATLTSVTSSTSTIFTTSSTAAPTTSSSAQQSTSSSSTLPPTTSSSSTLQPSTSSSTTVASTTSSSSTPPPTTSSSTTVAPTTSSTTVAPTTSSSARPSSSSSSTPEPTTSSSTSGQPSTSSSTAPLTSSSSSTTAVPTTSSSTPAPTTSTSLSSSSTSTSISSSTAAPTTSSSSTAQPSSSSSSSTAPATTSSSTTSVMPTTSSTPAPTTSSSSSTTAALTSSSSTTVAPSTSFSSSTAPLTSSSTTSVAPTTSTLTSSTTPLTSSSSTAAPTTTSSSTPAPTSSSSTTVEPTTSSSTTPSPTISSSSSNPKITSSSSTAPQSTSSTTVGPTTSSSSSTSTEQVTLSASTSSTPAPTTSSSSSTAPPTTSSSSSTTSAATTSASSSTSTSSSSTPTGTTSSSTTVPPTTTSSSSSSSTTSAPSSSSTPAPTTSSSTSAAATTASFSTTIPTTSSSTTAEPTTSSAAEPTTSPTTAEPTTSSSTTAEPTTSSTTAEPTTSSSTTAEPTTSSTSTTAEPTTSSSSAAEPATSSTTAEPSTSSSTTAEPTTSSTTAEPTTSSSSAAEPTPSSTTVEPSTSSSAPATTSSSTTASPPTSSASSSSSSSTSEPRTTSSSTTVPTTSSSTTASVTTSSSSTPAASSSSSSSEGPTTSSPSTSATSTTTPLPTSSSSTVASTTSSSTIAPMTSTRAPSTTPAPASSSTPQLTSSSTTHASTSSSALTTLAPSSSSSSTAMPRETSSTHTSSSSAAATSSSSTAGSQLSSSSSSSSSPSSSTSAPATTPMPTPSMPMLASSSSPAPSYATSTSTVTTTSSVPTTSTTTPIATTSAHVVPLSFGLRDTVTLLEDSGNVSVHNVSWDVLPSRAAVHFAFSLAQGPADLLLALEMLANGALRVEVAPDRSGVTVWNVTMALAAGCAGSASCLPVTRELAVSIVPVNDAPFFRVSSPVVFKPGSGAATRRGVAFDISKGAADESSQVLTFAAAFARGDASILAGQPQISDAGDLTVALRDGVGGSAVWNVIAIDNGGIEFGASDSYRAELEIIVLQTPPPVQDLALRQFDTTEVVVTWTHLSHDRVWDGPSFFLVAVSHRNSTVQVNVTMDGCTGPLCSVHVDSLSNGAVVTATVSAFNAAGSSDPRAVAITMLDLPSIPVGLRMSQRASGTGGGAILLFWQDSATPVVSREVEAWCGSEAAPGENLERLSWEFEGAALFQSAAFEFVGAHVEIRNPITASERIVCVPGDVLSFRMRARNQFFSSAWSLPRQTRLLAFPGDVQSLDSDAREGYVVVSWSKPSDTGYGDGAADIVRYWIESSACDSFDRRIPTCLTFWEAIPVTATLAYNLTRATLPYAGSYFVRVIAENALGRNPSPSFESIVFEASPVITFPSSFPVWVTFVGRSAHVWSSGSKRDSIVLTVRGFPPGFQFSAALSTGEEVQVLSASAAGEGGVMLRLLPPKLLASSQTTEVVLGAPNVQSGKSVRFALVYFTYPAPTVSSMFPQLGSVSGGTVVRLTVTEPTGARTSFSVGSSKLREAVVRGALAAALTCRGLNASAPWVQVSERAGSGLSAAIGYDVLLATPSSPCAGQGWSSLRLLAGSDAIELGGDALVFRYLEARIASVVPPSSLLLQSTVHVDALVVVEDFDPASTVESVALDGVPCAIAAQRLVRSRQRLELRIRIPSQGAQPGFAQLTASVLNHAGAQSNLSAPWEFIAPPPVLLVAGGISVDGRRQVLVSTSSESARVQVRVLNVAASYGRAFDSIEARVGQQRRTAQPAMVEGGLVVTFNVNGSDLQVGAQPLSIVGYESGQETFDAGLLDSGEVATLVVTDFNEPRVLAFAPSEGSKIGGAILAIAVSGLPMASAGELSCSFESDSSGVTADVLGFVSSEDISYDSRGRRTQLLGAALWSSLLQSSDVLVEQYESVLDVAFPRREPSTASYNVVLLVRSPAVQLSAPYRVLISRNSAIVPPFTFRTVEVGTSPRVVLASTDRGIAVSGSQGGGLLLVVIQNFPVVYHTSQVQVRFGLFAGRVLRLLGSDASATSLHVQIPAGDPGVVQLVIQQVPGASPWSLNPSPGGAATATTSFTFIDSNVPVVFEFSPFEVYSDLPNEVTVDLSGVSDSIDQDLVSVSLQDVDSGEVVALPVQTVVLRQNGRLRVLFATVASPAGRKLVFVTVDGRTAQPFEMSFADPPASGPEVVDTGTRSAICDDSWAVPVVVTNLRRLSSPQELVVQVGSNPPFDGTSEWVSGVASTLSSTSFELTVPVQATAGTLSVLVWSSAHASAVAATEVQCLDSSQASLNYMSPMHAPANANTTVLVSLDNFHSDGNSDVFLIVSEPVSGNVIRSSVHAKGTQVELQLHSSQVGSFDVSLAPCLPTDSCASKVVTMVLGFYDAGAVRISSFAPTSEFVYGGTTMQIKVLNLPRTSTADVVVQLQANTSITAVEWPSQARSPATVWLTIPAFSNIYVSEAQLLAPVLHVLSLGLAVPSPTPFRFLPASTPRIARITPTSALLYPSSQIRMVLENFPPVQSASELRVSFTFANKAEVVAETLSFQAGSQQARGTMSVDVLSPQGRSVQEGVAEIRVSHTGFDGVSAVDVNSAFTFVGPTRPRVSSMESEHGFGAREMQVPMSTATQLTITLSNAPLSVPSAAAQILFEDAAMPLVVVGVDEAARTLRLSCSVPPSASTGPRHALLAFGDPSTAECSPACCATSSCSRRCAIPTACFAVTYFDDSLPSFSVSSDLSGPSYGSDLIEITAANFPAVESAEDLLVYFGDARRRARVVITQSDEAATVMTVITPSMDIGSAAELTVPVYVSALSRADRGFSLRYTYHAMRPYVHSVNPHAASSLGGATVVVAINNFPLDRSVWVVFGDVILGKDDVRVLDVSNTEQVLVSFTTPATAPGLVEIQVTPQGCGYECSSTVHADFVQLDTLAPRLETPIPTEGPFQEEKMPTLTIANSPVGASASDITVLFTHSANSSLVFEIGGVGFEYASADSLLLEIPHPHTRHAGHYQVSIMLFGYTMTFDYELYDVNAVRLQSSAGTRVPISALVYGRKYELQQLVFVSVANFPQTLGVSDIVADMDAETAVEIQAVQDTTTCVPAASGCRRTQITLLSPSVEAPGVKTVTLYPADRPDASVEFSIEYVVVCEWEVFCGGLGSIVDTKKLVDDPAIECSASYCLAASAIGNPVIDSVYPSSGLETGGDLVTISLRDFPAMSKDAVSVRVGTRVAGVEAMRVLQGSGLERSSTQLDIRTPASVGADPIAQFTISTRIGPVVRRASFEFLYRPVISGNSEVVVAEPAVVYQGETVDMFVEMGNFPQLPQPWDPAEITILVDGIPTQATSIVSSDSSSTAFTMSLSVSSGADSTTLSVFANNYGIETAGVVEIQAVPQPAPTLVSWYPQSARSGEEVTVIVVIAHVLEPGAVSAQLALPNGTMLLLGVSQPQTLAYSDCTQRSCFKAEFRVAISPDQSASLALELVVLNIVVSVDASAFEVPFTFTPSTAVAVELVEPSVIRSSRSGSDVAVFLRNFPSPGCGLQGSCAEEAKGGNVGVLVGGKAGTIVAIEDVDGLLSVSFTAPALSSAGVKQATIASRDWSAQLVSTSFEITYTDYIENVAPIDGLVSGGTAVTVTAVGWGADSLVQSPATLWVRFANRLGAVLQVLESVSTPVRSSVTVVVAAPAASKPGLVPCQLGTADGSWVASFRFDYVAPPIISSVFPPRASMQGVTSAPDGRSVLVSIRNFPLVSSAADVEVSFGGSACGAMCRITGVESSDTVVALQITVPAAKAGKTSVSVRYIGQEQAPSYGDAVSTYTRIEKRAEAAFEYFAPQMLVQSAMWCSQCNTGRTCLVNGRCGDGSLPLVHAAPSSGGGVLTLLVLNSPSLDFDVATGTITDDEAVVSLSLGSFGAAVVDRVAWSDGALMALELSAPPVSPPEHLSAQLVVRPAGARVRSRAAVAMDFFDDRTWLRCDGGCDGPAGGGSTVTVRVGNLPVLLDRGITDQVDVRLGSRAVSMEAASFNATTMELRVVVPDNVCRSCAFSSGKAIVQLTVSLRSAPSVGVSTDFSFWRAPLITSARFDSVGTTVWVLFDQATDRAGAESGGSSLCSLLLAPESLGPLGGVDARCAWTAADALRIYLGPDATVLPLEGAGIVVLDGVISSKNGVASSVGLVAQIRGPRLPRTPQVQLKGPASIDSCSALTVRAIAASPRQMTFAWRCDNDAGLDNHLRTLTGPELYLAPGAAAMSTVDKEYTITVTATDFLGATSDTAVMAVRKTGAATPSFSLSPPSLAVFRDQPVNARIEAGFSRCAIQQAAMEFEWFQIAGPPVDELLASNLSQLAIPSHTLTPGAEYTLGARVLMSNDASKTVKASLRITVLQRPLVAIIAGGSSLAVSTAAPLRLDASASTDPDSDEAGALMFEWACYRLDGLRTACRDANGLPLVLPAGVDASVVVLPPGSLPFSADPNAYYYFSVTVSTPSKTPASFTMPVQIVGPGVPTATIASLGSSMRSDGSLQVNAGERLVFRGECDSPAARLSWSLDPRVDLSDYTQAAVLDGNKTLVFLEGNALLLHGNAYAVSFLCEHGSAIGSARLSVVAALPPTGRPCEACLLGSGKTCVKEGAPIVDRFVMSCDNWVHADMPLVYQFGYSGTFDGEFRDFSFDWNLSPSVRMMLPAGEVTMRARVRSSLGATSAWMYDVVNVVPVAQGRRTISVGGLGIIAQDVLVPELNRGQPGVVNRQMSTLLVEAEQQSASVDASQMIDLKENMAHVLADAVDIAVLDEGYVCETLGVIELLTSRPEHQTPFSVADTTRLVHDLVSSPLVLQLPASCAAAAVSIVSANLAVQYENVTCSGAADTDASFPIQKTAIPLQQTTLAQMEAIMDQVLAKSASVLELGEVAVIDSRSAVTTVVQNTLSSVAGSSFELDLSAAGFEAHGAATVAVSLPASLVKDAGMGPSSVAQVLVGAATFSPILNGVEPASPLIRVHLSVGGQSLRGASLTEAVRVTTPVRVPDPCGSQTPHATFECLSLVGSSYTSEHCTTQQTSPTQVACECTLLADIVVAVSGFDATPRTTPSATEPERSGMWTTAADWGAVPPTLTAVGLSNSSHRFPGFVVVQVAGRSGSKVNASLDRALPTCAGQPALAAYAELFLSESANVSAIACGADGPSAVVSSLFTILPAPHVEVRCSLAESPTAEAMTALEHVVAAAIPVDARRVRSFFASTAARRAASPAPVAVAFRILSRSGDEASALQHRLRELQLRALLSDSLGWDAAQVSELEVVVIEPDRLELPPELPPPPSSPLPLPTPPSAEASEARAGLIMAIAAPMAALLVLCAAAGWVYRRREFTKRNLPPSSGTPDKPKGKRPAQPQGPGSAAGSSISLISAHRALAAQGRDAELVRMRIDADFCYQRTALHGTSYVGRRSMSLNGPGLLTIDEIDSRILNTNEKAKLARGESASWAGHSNASLDEGVQPSPSSCKADTSGASSSSLPLGPGGAVPPASPVDMPSGEEAAGRGVTAVLPELGEDPDEELYAGTMLSPRGHLPGQALGSDDSRGSVGAAVGLQPWPMLPEARAGAGAGATVRRIPLLGREQSVEMSPTVDTIKWSAPYFDALFSGEFDPDLISDPAAGRAARAKALRKGKAARPESKGKGKGKGKALRSAREVREVRKSVSFQSARTAQLDAGSALLSCEMLYRPSSTAASVGTGIVKGPPPVPVPNKDALLSYKSFRLPQPDPDGLSAVTCTAVFEAPARVADDAMDTGISGSGWTMPPVPPRRGKTLKRAGTLPAGGANTLKRGSVPAGAAAGAVGAGRRPGRVRSFFKRVGSGESARSVRTAPAQMYS